VLSSQFTDARNGVRVSDYLTKFVNINRFYQYNEKNVENCRKMFAFIFTTVVAWNYSEFLDILSFAMATTILGEEVAIFKQRQQL